MGYTTKKLRGVLTTNPAKLALVIIAIAAILGMFSFVITSVISDSGHSTTVTTTIVLITMQTNATATPSLVTITNTTSSLISPI